MTEIVHVSDTAFLIAGLPRVRDRPVTTAVLRSVVPQLAGEYGKQAPATRGLTILAWSVAIRTVIIDDLIEQAVAEGVDTILNLSAGLDTRPSA